MKNVIFKALSAVVMACVALSLMFTAGPAAETAYAATGTGSIKVDGVTKDSKFTALKKEGNNLVAGPTLSVQKDGLWNNNTEEDKLSENMKTAESANKDLTYTKLSGKAKGCSYVRLGVLKKK